ncbi:hypothetical protein SAMN05216326_1616 [Nitrosomonas marina]|uniref:Cas10/Cmr2 second palm domain-containing protein n=1 Tax=Nitrosomonas marina TaxID=917 RepID=A0A1I0GAS7_9PROT|nr:hypothetical protein [Nitrosomonas marina]SET68156.1 hypothetical protein SAMN05216326_1616 [Nitrosomonas marina]
MFTYHLYFFEAHSIQSYIFDSGRMADMVGASELIEALLEEPLVKTLQGLPSLRGMSPKKLDSQFTRKGGAAFTVQLPDKNSAIQLRDIWGLVVPEIAPGLLFSHAISQGESLQEAMQNGRKKLQILRNRENPRLPVAGPLIIRAPRTGSPAVSFDRRKHNDNEIREEWIDQASLKKRQFRKGDRLIKKFILEEDTQKHFTFPLNLEPEEEDAFPFESDNHYVAIIHIDGNGLGEVLIKLNESLKEDADSAKKLRHFSEKLKSVTENSARAALTKVFTANETRTETFPKNKDNKIILPFRPLILGGDDLTVIIRAEFALEFVKRFVETFERENEAWLKNFDSNGIVSKLTACGGVAFVKVNQPFYLAYQLAESLCSFAKKEARQNKVDGTIPSTVAMHRITSSFISDYETALNEEMTQKDGDGKHIYLTLGAYGLGQYAGNFPALDTLLKLKDLFQTPEMSRGPLRNFLTLLHAQPSEAPKIYDRWQQNLKKVCPYHYQEYHEYIKALWLSEAGVSESSIFKSKQGKPDQTFVGDLMHLLAVEGEAHGR